ncbi:MAG: tetratricopeptide repeat-containing glycosyltransferase family protein [Tepidisphaeraceae bacterium]
MSDQDFIAATGHHRAGRVAEARVIYQRILGENPNHAEARAQWAYLLFQERRLDEALGEIQRAIGQGASVAASHNTLGLVLVGLGRTEEGIAIYRKAISVRGDLPELHNNLGTAYEVVERFEEAEASLRRALALRANLAEAHDNLGRVLKKRGRFAEAVAEHTEAIRIQPDHASAHLNLGMLYLLLGDLPRGWDEIEWRWKIVGSSVRQPAFDEKYWDGGELAGRRILLHPEGGFGDAIQMLRFVPWVAGRGGKVVLGVPRDLASLLANYPGVSELVPSGQPVPDFDVHCPQTGLPRLFGATTSNIPGAGRYIHPPGDRIEYWRGRLAADGGNLKVGLVWAGRPDYANDHHRSIALSQLAPLAGMGGVSFYSLQKGTAAEQAKRPPEGLKLIDCSAELSDYLQTAALVANLDLVISVDTSVVHVAGALGRPVWVLLPWVPDWRWMLNREDSPWYATARLFRQPAYRDWESPIRRVADALGELIAARSG